MLGLSHCKYVKLPSSCYERTSYLSIRYTDRVYAGSNCF